MRIVLSWPCHFTDNVSHPHKNASTWENVCFKRVILTVSAGQCGASCAEVTMKKRHPPNDSQFRQAFGEDCRNAFSERRRFKIWTDFGARCRLRSSTHRFVRDYSVIRRDNSEKLKNYDLTRAGHLWKSDNNTQWKAPAVKWRIL